jgi:integrase
MHRSGGELVSISKRRNGSYTVRIDIERDHGKRRKVTVGTFATKKEAERAERDALQSKDRGIDLNPERIDVAALLDRYVRDRAALGRGAKTVERYGEIVRLYLKPHIGSVPLSKLKPAHVSELVTILGERGGAKGGRLSPKSVKHAFSLLSGALSWAMRHELVGRNVAAAVEAPSIPRGTAVALSVDEANRFLAAVDGTRWGPFMRLALACGARRGELLALRWNDVDFEAATITIRGALSQTRAGIFEKATKTDRVRTVALSPHAVEAVRRQRANRAQERLAAGIAFCDSGHVFQRERGGLEMPFRATEAFRVIAQAVGISTTRLHALRHTTGSWLIASGVDPRTAASVLGHSSPMVTLGIYSHLVVGMQKAAVAHIDDRLTSTSIDAKRR